MIKSKIVGSVSNDLGGSLWSDRVGSVSCGQVGSIWTEFPLCIVLAVNGVRGNPPVNCQELNLLQY